MQPDRNLQYYSTAQIVPASHNLGNRWICISSHFYPLQALVHQLTEVEISCLPKALPEFVEVNVSNLVVGDSVHISDLELPSGVQSVELGKGEGHDLSVVTIKANKAAPTEEEASDAAE